MSAKNYELVHKKNIITEVKVPKDKIEPGTIVSFNYKGKNVHQARPLVLVLNERWNNKLHGIALRILSEKELLDLANVVNTSLKKKIANKIKFGLGKTKSGIGNPERFYKLELKPYLKNIKESSYRTYLYPGITAVSVVDYKFKEMNKNISKGLK